MPTVCLSALDGNRFGVKAAWARSINAETLPEALSFCASNEVRLLMARCQGDDMGAIHAVEKQGFLLMDMLVYFRLSLGNLHAIPPAPEGVQIREAAESDADQIAAVAQESFTGYQGHYHADPRLDPASCTAIYRDWAVRSLSREVADAVMVAECGGRLAGFITLCIAGEEGTGELCCVSPRFRRRGIYKALLQSALAHFQGQGLSSMIYSTQMVNLVAQNSLTSLGFRAHDLRATFHKWFD